MNALAGIILTLLAVVLRGVLHSLLAAPRTKQRLRRRFGPKTDRGYRLFYNGFAAVTLLPVFAISARVPGLTLYQIPSPWVFLTAAI